MKSICLWRFVKIEVVACYDDVLLTKRHRQVKTKDGSVTLKGSEGDSGSTL